MVLIYIGLVIASSIMIWKISDIFEDATEYLGRNMTGGVKGASLNAIGSSMPELLTSFIFLFWLTGSEGYEGTIGTTAGSAVFNSLLIPALVIGVVFIGGFIANKRKGIALDRKVLLRDGIALILSEIALIIVISTNTITLFDGVILLVMYAIYAVVLKNWDNSREEYDEGTPEETRSAWTNLIVATIGLSLACALLVWAVDGIGVELEIPLIFTSVVFAAAASSVPDTFISIRDGMKGNYDDAVANAIGSNIFDILVAHGLPLTLYIMMYGPIVMSPETTENSIELRIGLIAVTILAIGIYLYNHKGIFMRHSIYLVILYGSFIAYAVCKALGIVIF